MEHIIEIHHLSRSFGSLKAVDDLSFSVRRGELFAFLGVNGAGKSTTISILCGQLPADSGKVLVCGRSIQSAPEDIRRRLGVVFQASALDAALSVRDNLRSRAALYGISGSAFEARLRELCGLLELAPLLDRPVGKLSGGQRRRIDIARALLHKPEILVLDEPTTGLDPQTRKLLWDVVTTLREQTHMTVFLTTHYMEEAAGADYVVILDHGRLVAEGSPLALKNAHTGDALTVYGVEETAVQALGYPCCAIRDGFRISLPDTAAARNLILAHPELFSDFEVTKGQMDDVFLAVTGKKLPGGDER